MAETTGAARGVAADKEVEDVDADVDVAREDRMERDDDNITEDTDALPDVLNVMLFVVEEEVSIVAATMPPSFKATHKRSFRSAK